MNTVVGKKKIKGVKVILGKSRTRLLVTME